MSDERVWLRNPTTGGVQHFAAEAVAVWKARGWEETDPPEEPNIWRDQPQPEQPAEAPETPVDNDTTGEGDKTPAQQPGKTQFKNSTRRGTATGEE